MCGRFSRNYTWAEISALYRLTSTPWNIQPNFNVCPTQPVDVVISGEGNRVLVQMRWGLIPYWWKKPLKEMKSATFNARAETISKKPMFRDSFLRRRCLMPISGYYEWKNTSEGKQPFYFTRHDGQVKLAAEVHDRMPVILEAKDFEQWEHGDVKDATALMKPANENVLQKWPVSKRVTSSRADGADATLVAKIAG
jgi:putative SOS response-associated peptidase YedK